MARYEMRFIYQIKSILKIPIMATSAAEPIIRMLPPVPAQYASNSQNACSVGQFMEYIPIVAAP
jgi:hypothetical protein